MYGWLPDDVVLKSDISEAAWVVERLRPWGDTYPQPAACFLPDIFEAYARILHPGREYKRLQDGSTVVVWKRWSELGERRGVQIGAETEWQQASGFPLQSERDDGIEDPREGSMPDVLVEAVSAFVSRWTTTPRKTWFGMWEGNGMWWKGAHAVVSSGTGGPSAEDPRIDDERDRVLRATPRFGTPQRQYFLMSGPLSAATSLTKAAGRTSPNLWWPDDRAWFVSTEVDDVSTYLGGSSLMIEALLASPDIEAVPASPDTRLFS